MRHYTWQMRIELTLKDDVKPAQLYQMRFDPDGLIIEHEDPVFGGERTEEGLRLGLAELQAHRASF